MGNALHGQHGKLHHTGEDGHGTDGHIAAVAQQGGIEADGNNALAALHNEGRQAQSQTGKNQLGHNGEILLLQAKRCLLAAEEENHPYAGNCLRNHRGQCCTLNPHAKGIDKQGIQHNVDHGTDQHGHHAGFGEALCCNEGVHAQGQLHKDGADGIDVHVIHSVLDGVFTGAKGKQHITVP